MGTETYPKKAPSSYGEQKAKTFVSAKGSVTPEINQVGSKTSYPAKGHAGPLSRHQSHEKTRAAFATGASGALRSETYPGKVHGNFPSEQGKGKLKAPVSDKPRAA